MAELSVDEFLKPAEKSTGPGPRVGKKPRELSAEEFMGKPKKMQAAAVDADVNVRRAAPKKERKKDSSIGAGLADRAASMAKGISITQDVGPKALGLGKTV